MTKFGKLDIGSMDNFKPILHRNGGETQSAHADFNNLIITLQCQTPTCSFLLFLSRVETRTAMQTYHISRWRPDGMNYIQIQF